MPWPVTLKNLIWMVLWRPTRSSRTNTPKRCPFHHRGLECKRRKSRDTWSNRKNWPWSNRKNWPWSNRENWPWSTKWSRENAGVIANTLFQEHRRRLYTWTSPDGQSLNHTDYILCRQRWRSSIQSAKTSPGAHCGSDHGSLLPNSELNWRK